jgi:hypothetical protein
VVVVDAGGIAGAGIAAGPVVVVVVRSVVVTGGASSPQAATANVPPSKPTVSPARTKV